MAGVIFSGEFMVSYFSQILNVILVFVVTLILNFSVEYLTSDKGVVRVGEVMLVGDVNYKPIDIHNFSNESIEKLKLSIPKDSIVSSLVVSNPLEVKAVSNSVTSKSSNIIEISSIPSHAVTRILIPIKNGVENCCELLNANELRLSIKSDGEVNNPLQSALYQAFITATISTLLIVAFMVWTNLKIKELETRSEKNSTKLDAIELRSEELEINLKNEVLEAKKLNKRQRMYLLKRITEYSKEIDFWRDTLRKIVSKDVSKEQVDYLLRDISKSLGTHSTHGKAKREYAEFELMFDVVSSVSEEAKI